MAIQIFKAEDINAAAEENRRFFYTQEADPLFMQVQRGEIPVEQWTAKIQEIKDHFPYVTEDREVDYPDFPEGSTTLDTTAHLASQSEGMA